MQRVNLFFVLFMCLLAALGIYMRSYFIVLVASFTAGIWANDLISTWLLDRQRALYEKSPDSDLV